MRGVKGCLTFVWAGRVGVKADRGGAFGGVVNVTPGLAARFERGQSVRMQCSSRVTCVVRGSCEAAWHPAWLACRGSLGEVSVIVRDRGGGGASVSWRSE